MVFSGFFVPKGDGKRVRLVTDYTKLNKFVIRPVHPFPSVADIVQSIPATSTCFAKLDATHGYFQIPLSKDASELLFFYPQDAIAIFAHRWVFLPLLMSGVVTLIEWSKVSHGARRL